MDESLSHQTVGSRMEPLEPTAPGCNRARSILEQTKQVTPSLPQVKSSPKSMWLGVSWDKPNTSVRNSMWLNSINKVNEMILDIPRDETTKTVQQVGILCHGSLEILNRPQI